MLTQRHLLAARISAAENIRRLFGLSLTRAAHLPHSLRTHSLCAYFVPDSVLDARGTRNMATALSSVVVLTLGTSQNHLGKCLKCRFLGSALRRF